MSEKKELTFAEGMRAFNRKENAPESIRLNLIINDSFIEWYKLYAEDGKVRIDLRKSPKGTYYFTYNDFKPRDIQQGGL